jgi:hypothetical protein
MHWKPLDVIACIVIIGCLVMKGLGFDSILSWALLVVVAGYYGIDLTPFIKLGRNQKTDNPS